MKMLESGQAWKSLLLPAALAGVVVALLAAGRAVAFGGPSVQGRSAESPAATGVEPVVVLVGGYGCTLTTYVIYQPPSPPQAPPGDDPAATRPEASALDETPTYTELSHSVSITGTGGVTSPPPSTPAPAPIGVGPGFGGRGPIVGGRVPWPDPITVVSPGIGTGGTFPGGTIDDCRRFTEAVLATTRTRGCAVSDLRERSTVPPSVVQQQSLSFSFVCEGPASAQIHTIGEVNRAVISQAAAPAP